MDNKIIECVDLGTIAYLDALKIQHDLKARRMDGEIGDRLLLLEHERVFTMGKRRIEEDFLLPRDQIKLNGIDVVETDRGGRVTYHGPGQLVAYFIFELGKIGVKAFVSMLEQVCMKSATALQINSRLDHEHPGLWIGDEKVAAIGIHVDRNVTMHGIAVNIDCDLSPYKYIVACGIKDKGVTTLAKAANVNLTVGEYKKIFVTAVEAVFGRQIKMIS